MTRRDALLLVLLGAIWGSIYPLTAVVLRELSPPTIVFLRTALSALVLVPLAVRGGVLSAVRARPGAVLIAAVLQVTIPLILLTVAQQYVAAGLTGILVATQPVWAAVLAAATNRSMPLRLLTGVLLGLAGVVVLFPFDLGSSSTWGALALVAAAGCIAAGSVWTERVLPEVPPLGTAAATMMVSTLTIVPFVSLTATQIPNLLTVGSLLILSVVATAGALVLFYTLIHRVGAARANLAATSTQDLLLSIARSFSVNRLPGEQSLAWY